MASECFRGPRYGWLILFPLLRVPIFFLASGGANPLSRMAFPIHTEVVPLEPQLSLTRRYLTKRLILFSWRMATRWSQGFSFYAAPLLGPPGNSSLSGGKERPKGHIPFPSVRPSNLSLLHLKRCLSGILRASLGTETVFFHGGCGEPSLNRNRITRYTSRRAELPQARYITICPAFYFFFFSALTGGCLLSEMPGLLLMAAWGNALSELQTSFPNREIAVRYWLDPNDAFI